MNIVTILTITLLVFVFLAFIAIFVRILIDSICGRDLTWACVSGFILISLILAILVIIMSIMGSC